MNKSIYIFRRVGDVHLKLYETKNIIDLVIKQTGKTLQQIETAHTDELYIWLNETYKAIDKHFLIMTSREYEIALHYCKRYGLIGNYFLEYNREYYEFVNGIYHWEGKWGESYKPYYGNIYLVRKQGKEMPYDKAGIQTILEHQDARQPQPHSVPLATAKRAFGERASQQQLLDFTEGEYCKASFDNHSTDAQPEASIDNKHSKQEPDEKYKDYITDRSGVRQWFDMPLDELYEYTKKTYKEIDEAYEVCCQDEYERLYKNNKEYVTLDVVTCMQAGNRTEAVYLQKGRI